MIKLAKLGFEHYRNKTHVNHFIAVKFFFKIYQSGWLIVKKKKKNHLQIL